MEVLCTYLLKPEFWDSQSLKSVVGTKENCLKIESKYFIKYLKISSTAFERGIYVASHVGSNIDKLWGAFKETIIHLARFSIPQMN